MNADGTFQIGAAHTVCQDYALAWNGGAPGAPVGGEATAAPGSKSFVVLCDGCSSSPDTDTGARLLARAAAQLFARSTMPNARETPWLHLEAARRALASAEVLGLTPQAVDATLLTAHVEGGELILACTGDGVLCLRSRLGALDVFSVAFPSGYPVYPAYAHQPRRLVTLFDAGRAVKEVRHLRSDSPAAALRPRDERGGESLTEVFAVPARDYEFAALLSDGVHSFYAAVRGETSKGSEPVPLGDVLPELVSFKNSRGAFVGRRAKRFLQECRARGWRHADDLAVAALHLGG
jgi:hypothetical protein